MLIGATADRTHGREQISLTAAEPGTLRDMMLKMVGRHGQDTTEGTETREGMAAVSNSLTKVGEDLLKPLNDIRDISGYVLDKIGDVGSILRDVYKATEGDPAAKKRLEEGVVGQFGESRAVRDTAIRST